MFPYKMNKIDFREGVAKWSFGIDGKQDQGDYKVVALKT
jgi:hypothetical protein